MKELQTSKKNREKWHILSVVICISMLFLKVLFYIVGWTTAMEKEIMPFIFIGGTTWTVLLGAILFNGAFLKDFDVYAPEKLQRADEAWRMAGNVMAVGTMNPGLYQSKDNEAINYGKTKGIHRGGRKWNAVIIFLVGIIPTIFDELIIGNSSEALILVVFTIVFFLTEILFSITTQKWNEENTFIAAGSRPLYPGRILIVYIVCLIIGYTPYLSFLCM